MSKVGKPFNFEILVCYCITRDSVKEPNARSNYREGWELTKLTERMTSMY